MHTATCSEFRNHAKHYFDIVENGKIIQIYRHEKPVALLMPIGKKDASRWKETKPLKLPGASLTKALLAEREE